MGGKLNPQQQRFSYVDTHASTTDTDSRLYRKGKGKESKLCNMGHALTKNRNRLIVETAVTEATTHQEWASTQKARLWIKT